MPVPEVAPTSLDDDQVAAQAGADLIAQTPDVARLVAGIEGPLVLGNYAYADGADHVRVSMAADALAVELADRADVMLAYLATPTDAFAVPWRDVEISQGRWDHRRTRLVQPPLHLLGTFKRNYSDTITTSDGTRLGIADCLVPQQGPNYALAKRLQRWRAVVARNAGTRVSLNVAPATRTRSVVKNRLLAAAYAGAHRFGIRVFDPGTANTLMAAMLVHDLRNPDAAANPAVALSNPMDLFSRAANHGGLWTTGYEPRSVAEQEAGEAQNPSPWAGFMPVAVGLLLSAPLTKDGLSFIAEAQVIEGLDAVAEQAAIERAAAARQVGMAAAMAQQWGDLLRDDIGRAA